MPTVQNSTTPLELIKNLPAKTSLSSTDLYLIQTQTQSFKLTHDDLAANLADNVTTFSNNGKLSVSADSIYPIGSVYINAAVATNPSTLLGFGTWVRIGQGRVLIGEGSGTDINGDNKNFTNGSIGGEYEHTLTEDELASHTHNLKEGNFNTLQGDSTTHIDSTTGIDQNSDVITQSAGDDQPHNNIQPYLTVYMWKRTA